MSEGETTEFVLVPNPLVETLRSLGVPLRGLCFEGGRRIHASWSTDRALAEAAAQAGAKVTFLSSQDERFSGWEISTPREILEPVDSGVAA